jgi:outer membrane protein TolC
LETAGKRSKRIAEAGDVADSAHWAVITTAWQVRGTVRDTLLDWQMAERRSQLLNQQCALQEQVVKRSQQRAEAGDIGRPELVSAQIIWQKMQMDRLDARAKSSDAHARLAAALGLSAGALHGIKIIFDQSTNVPPALTATEARRVALQSRSDILGALADYTAAQDDLRLEIARQYPDIHLGPGYQYNQGDNQWMMGLSLELPVLNRNQGPIAEAQARRQLAAAKFRALQAQVIGEIDQAVTGYDLAQQQLESAAALLKTEQKQEASLQAQVQAGALDHFDLLAAQLELSAATLTELDTVTRERQARGALEDALQYPLDAFTRAAVKNISQAPNERASLP